MSVASGVEFGDVCEVALALLPEIIGNIETVIGGVTIRRTGEIAVQVAVGNPVCRGDVIETAADGQIGIRFIDGTVFNLSRDTRVMLSEFIYGSNRNHSALVAVTRGTFAFMAGGLARTGSFWVDTPVGSIRGRAYAGGMGMLSLAALVFSFIKEAQAADPDVTFLDDDSITYKDFAHGAFELITKEAVPRHIIVEDPGETIVLSKIGSSVSVNPVANSPSRMEELRAAQQDVLANFAQGWAPLGSSTPDFLGPQHLLQPINFIQPDPTHPLNSLAPLEFAVFTFTVPEIVPHPPPPPPPTLEITGIGGQIGIATDNIINAAKASAGVRITGTTSGVEDGRIVTVTILDSSNHVVYSGTATVANNTWSINVSPAEARTLADGIDTLTADVSNTAGIPAEASQSFRVDETPPTIAIGTIVGNNVVNIKAASTGFIIAGTTTDAENGQPVTVKIVDSSGQVVGTFTTALTNNTWSVNVTSTEAKLLHDGSYTVTADVSDTAGNPAREATQTLFVDETPPTVTWLPRAESGIEGTAIALGTITATANSLPGHSNGVQSLVVSGIPVGAVLTDGSNSFMATSGDTTIDVRSWNLSDLKITPPNDINFTLTVTAADQDANTANTSELVTVAPLAPALNPVAAQGNEDTAIALDLGAMAKSLLGANGDASPNSLATLVVGDIPVGATLSDGTGLPGHYFTATAGNTSFDVAGWNLSSLKITPPIEFEGNFTLTIAATERDSEGDTSATKTATEVVTVKPVAEPPTASAPATLALNENATGVTIAGVSVGPLAEDADDTVSATLTVSHGTLHVVSLSGVTVTGDDCATVTLSGGAAAVNTVLAGLTYTPTTEYEGADTLYLSVTSSDGSNTYPTAATASTAITVDPVARPPTASAPPTLTLNENATSVAIAGLRVGPLAEDNDDTVSATLTVSQGTLHVASLSGVTVTGNDCATLTLSGDAAAVNTLLAGLTYTANPEYEGSDKLSLSVRSTDGGSTSSAATASTSITVKPVAEAPMAAAPTTLTFGEDADTVAIAGVSVGPLAEDNDDTVSATLTVSHGTLHVGSMSGVTVTGDDSATLTLSGSAAAVNMLLAGLIYMPMEEEGPDTLHLSVTSSDGSGSNTYPTPATATTAIRVEVDSESLIVGGPGPMLDWNDAANWSAGIVPTLGIDVTINAPSNYAAIITGAPVAQAESLTIPHGAASTDIAVGGTLQLAGNLVVSDAGKLDNDGTLEETANAHFIGPITNDGTIIVDPNVDLDVTGTITGNGKFWIDSGTTLEFARGTKVAQGTTDSQTIYFEQGAGKLVINDWGKFAGVITGIDIGTHLTSTDLIDLTQLPFVGGSMSASVSYNSGSKISTVTFSDGNSANNVTLHFSGDYTGATWSFTGINHNTGTEISDPPAASGTVTSGAIGHIAAASAATTDFASAGGTNTSSVPGNTQNFTGQVAGFTGDGRAGTPSASQTFASSPTRSAGGHGTFPLAAAAPWAYTPGDNSAANAPNIGDTLANIIMGGFGAVLLTGGNGNDTVVSSSVSDSNAPQFDTITNFLSGSDKIDLTAFGSVASVILALAPTSTSVPAHTIAWLYDSKANQTIVYVNPTDQAESIGDSCLLEIHLPRVATVHLSDFVLASTTATTIAAASDPSDLAVTTQSDATIVTATTGDISFDTTVSNKALFIAAQATNIGDNVDAHRDDVDSIDHAKFVSFDEGSVDSAATTLPGGLSVQLPHNTVTTQTSFAFDQKPVSASADPTTIEHGASMHGPTVDGGSGIVPSRSDWEVNPKTSSNGDNRALIPDSAEGSHAQELDANPIVTLDSRFLKTLETGRGDRAIAGDAGEHALHGPDVAGFEPSYLTQIMSEGTVGTLGHSFHFKDNVSGSKGSGVIGVVNDVPVSMNHDLEATGTHGPLSISLGELTPSTFGDSFHFKEISSFKDSGVNNFAEPDQIPTSITHNENAADPHGPPPISAPQTIEMSLLGLQSADSLGIVLHHPQSHFVTHDLIV